MSDKTFRKISLERVSSPEDLDSYIRVSNPGVWLLLAAAIVFLSGVCAWGITGRIDCKMDAAAYTEDGTTWCFVAEEEIASVDESLPVKIGDIEYAISEVFDSPVNLDTFLSWDDCDLVIHMCGLQADNNGNYWAYVLELEAEDLKDGVHAAQVITERISPVSFIFG